MTTPRIILMAALAALAAAPAAAEVELSTPTAVAELAEFVGAETCLSCHSGHSSFKDGVHAKAFEKGKGIAFDKSCETCHGPGSLHAAAGGDAGNKDFWTIRSPKRMSAKEAAANCMQCHSGGERAHWQGSSHDSRDVSCVSCHSMHSPKSDKGKALLTAVTPMESCFQCHNMKKAQLQRSSHMPLKEGKMDCMDCHNPHGGKGPSELKQASVNENCTTCHAEKKGPFLWEHPPVRENCMNCHLAHGSQHASLLKVKRPRLCQECHIESSHPTTASTPANLHLAGRACTECHSQVHGSNHPSGVRFVR